MSRPISGVKAIALVGMDCMWPPIAMTYQQFNPNDDDQPALNFSWIFQAELAVTQPGMVPVSAFDTMGNR